MRFLDSPKPRHTWVLMLGLVISFLLPCIAIGTRVVIGRYSGWQMPIFFEPLVLALIWWEFDFKFESLLYSILIHLAAISLGGSLAFLWVSFFTAKPLVLALSVKWLVVCGLMVGGSITARKQLARQKKMEDENRVASETLAQYQREDEEARASLSTDEEKNRFDLTRILLFASRDSNTWPYSPEERKRKIAECESLLDSMEPEAQEKHVRDSVEADIKGITDEWNRLKKDSDRRLRRMYILMGAVILGGIIAIYAVR